MSPNTPLFYQGSLPAEHFEVALAQRLGCHFVDAQHYHVPAEFTQRLYAPNMANILDYTKKRPEVIDRCDIPYLAVPPTYLVRQIQRAISAGARSRAELGDTVLRRRR